MSTYMHALCRYKKKIDVFHLKVSFLSALKFTLYRHVFILKCHRFVMLPKAKNEIQL